MRDTSASLFPSFFFVLLSCNFFLNASIGKERFAFSPLQARSFSSFLGASMNLEELQIYFFFRVTYPRSLVGVPDFFSSQSHIQGAQQELWIFFLQSHGSKEFKSPFLFLVQSDPQHQAHGTYIFKAGICRIRTIQMLPFKRDSLPPTYF